MTHRARWLILFAVAGLIAGVLREQVVLALLSLSAFLWVVIEWLRFQARLRFEIPHLSFERRVNDRTDTSGSLWVGRTVHIQIQLYAQPRTLVQQPAEKSPNPRGLVFTGRRMAALWGANLRISPVVHLRDVVPEILEVSDSTAVLSNEPLSELPSRASKPWAPQAAPQLVRWLLKLVAPLARPRGRKTKPRRYANEWTLDTLCSAGAFRYEVIPRAAGAATLPGLRLIIEDQCAFFQSHRFVPLQQTFRILPDYFQAGEVRPTVKRHNSLPQHGIHRLQREGAGSELLELREYVPGDPPKSIAWKVSARRNQLMTRKYESEVPVRVHLFIDGSLSTRSGGYGRRLLDQINYVAASVAKAATASGDPVGGMLVDDQGVRQLTWMTGDRGFMQWLKALADFAHAAPPIATAISPYMLRRALSVCQERYPELLDRRYHPLPFLFRSAARDRFRVANVLAELHDLSPADQVACYYDDTLMAGHLQKLLFSAGLPWMAPLFSAAVDPAVSGARSMRLLGDAMSRAIAHARDNEVFVVLADPLSCAPNLSHLLRVIKLALAKHHRVAMICPSSTFARPQTEIIRPQSRELADLLLAAEQVRLRDVAQYLKRELVRLGVAVSFSGEQSAIRLVLAEIALARDGRTQGRGVRA